MLRNLARRIPLVERLRAGFAAASALAPPAAYYALIGSRATAAPPFAASLTTSAPPHNSGSGGSGGVDPAIERFNALFAEARDEIEYAREDAETTYFNESVETAKKAVDEALSAWHDALNNAPDEAARGAMQRASGLKVEQLKAELQALDEIHA
jgi:hypothetical protein